MADEVDYEAMGQEEPSDDDLHRVAILAQKQLELQAKIAQNAVEARELGEKLILVSEVDLPELMKEIGMKKFTLTSGEEILIDHQTFASITKKNQPDAFKWLKDNNFDGIIKGEVKVALGKGEIEQIAEIARILSLNGFDSTHSKSVHWQTLKAFVKEQIEEGSNFPRELFGVYEKDVSIIK